MTADTRLKDALAEKQYDLAIDLLRNTEAEHDLTPPELVTLGRCIQLSERDGTLDEAQAAFESALALDPDYIPALLEMGWFFYAVMNDAVQAAPFFKSALDKSEALLREASEGSFRCMLETNGPDAALELLDRIYADINSKRAEIVERANALMSDWERG